MAVEANHLHLFSPHSLLKTRRDQFVDNQSIPMADTVPPRKRLRDSFSFLGEDITSHVHNQIAEVDRVIIQHAEKMRMEVMERRRQFTRSIVVAVEERLSKRIKAKDEEIEHIGRVNWALEEKIKSLANENQIWRYLAQTNETTANELRIDLEHALTEQIRIQEDLIVATAHEFDLESCCDNCDDDDDKDESAVRGGRRLCRSCCVREPTVLLLPCRHLCLCAKCDPGMDECPICKSFKNGSVHVNLS